jgi:hypothetical protein
LAFLQVGNESLAFADEIGLFEGNFDHLAELSALEDSQVVFFLALDED